MIGTRDQERLKFSSHFPQPSKEKGTSEAGGDGTPAVGLLIPLIASLTRLSLHYVVVSL